MNHSIQSYSPRVKLLDYDAIKARNGSESLHGGSTWFDIPPFDHMRVTDCSSCDGNTSIFAQSDKISYAKGPLANMDQPWWNIRRSASVLQVQTSPNQFRFNNPIGGHVFAVNEIIQIGTKQWKITGVTGTSSLPIVSVTPSIISGDVSGIAVGAQVFTLSADGYVNTAAMNGTIITLTVAGDLAHFSAGQTIWMRGENYVISSVTGSQINISGSKTIRTTNAIYTPVYVANVNTVFPQRNTWVAWRAPVGVRYGKIESTGYIELTNDFGPENVGTLTHLGLDIAYNALGIFEYDLVEADNLHCKKVSLAFTDWGSIAVCVFDYDVKYDEFEVSYRSRSGVLYSQEWQATSAIIFNYNQVRHADPNSNPGLVIYYIRAAVPGTLFARFEAESWAVERIIFSDMRVTLTQLITMLPDDENNRRAILFAKTDDGRCVELRTPSFDVAIENIATLSTSIIRGTYGLAGYEITLDDLRATLTIGIDSGAYFTSSSEDTSVVLGSENLGIATSIFAGAYIGNTSGNGTIPIPPSPLTL